MTIKLVGPLVVPDAKITRYLLDSNHPIGSAKARFLQSFGFAREDPHALASALLRHAAEHSIHAERHHSRGVNRELRCGLVAPDGRTPCVVVIWFQALGEIGHRLVTVYPFTG